MRVTCHTLRAWINNGWLDLQSTPRQGVCRTHPSLEPLQAYLAQNPRRHLNALALKFSVSETTLRSWERRGLIKIERIHTKPDNSLYWLHDNSNLKAYDPTMVKSSKP